MHAKTPVSIAQTAQRGFGNFLTEETIMNRRNMIIFGGVIAALVLIPIVWWLASPLWRTDAVNEEFPFDLPTVSEAEAMPADELEAKLVEAMEMADEMSDEMTDEEMDAVSEQMQDLAAVMPDKEML